MGLIKVNKQLTEEMGPRSFGLGETAKLLGLTKRRISYLADHEMISSDGGNPDGRGSRRYFTIKNLMQLAIMSKLSKFKIHHKTVSNVVQELGNTGYFDKLNSSNRTEEVAFIYINPDGKIELRNGKPVDIENKEYHSFIVVNLPEIEKWVVEAVKK